MRNRILQVAILRGMAVAYLVFCCGLYLGAQPFGIDLIDKVAGPLKLAKRTVLGGEPLLVSYAPVEPAVAVFSAAPSVDTEAIALNKPDLASALPAAMGPAPGAMSLSELLRNSKRGFAPTRVQRHSVRVAASGGYRIVLHYGWGEAEFLSSESTLSSCVFVVVPGTGIDKAAKILAREGYHEQLVDQLPCQKLVYVKPNHGSRQISYAGQRAEFDYVYATMIANGGSYSYWYLSELIDAVLYFKELGVRVAIGGLSQGGNAALLVGAVTKPDLTVVLSGYFDPTKGMLSNQHQILIDGILPMLAPDRLAEYFTGQALIFSYGRRDLPVFRHEAQTQESCKAFAAKVARFTCLIHDGGHSYPPGLLQLATAAMKSSAVTAAD